MKIVAKFLWTALGVSLILGLYWGFNEPEYFTENYMKEDGLIEYATVVLLLGAIVILGRRWLKLHSRHSLKFSWITGIAMVGLFFIAGEELSWGQRIFSWETTDYFKQHNTQEELNLHNLMVGDVKVNKLVFGLILTTVIMVYMVLLPLLYHRVKPIQKLVDEWFIPVPRLSHSLGYLIMTGIISLIPASKNWELLEFGSVVILVLLLLKPVNLQSIEPF